MNREQIEKEVARLAHAWAAAELQRDTAFLEKLLQMTSSGSDRSDFC